MKLNSVIFVYTAAKCTIQVAKYHTTLIKIATYNMHGIKQGSPYLRELCCNHDIIFVQKHWLAPFLMSHYWMTFVQIFFVMQHQQWVR